MPPLGAAACAALLVALAVALRARSPVTLVALTGAVAAIAPLAAEVAPPVPELAFRAGVAGLATWLAVRLARTIERPLDAPLLGGTAEVLFATAAALTGLAATGWLAPVIDRPADVALVVALADGPALAGALALGTVAIVLLAFARESLRVASGAVYAVLAADLGARALLAGGDALTAVAGSVAAAAALVAGTYVAADGATGTERTTASGA